MPEIAAKVEALGHVITHKWWEVETPSEDVELHRQHATLDYQGVCAADMLIVLNSTQSEGKAVEQGIALGLDKPIMIIGKLGEKSKNIFHYMNRYLWVENLDQMVKALETIKWVIMHAR